MSKRVKQENQEPVDANYKNLKALRKGIPDLSCSNTSLKERINRNEAKTCKAKKETLTNAAPSRGKRNLKRKKSIDNGVSKNKQKSGKHIKAQGSENEKGVTSKSTKKVEENRNNSKTSSFRRIKKEIDKDSDSCESKGNSNKDESDESELQTSEAVFTCDICNEMLIGRVYFEQHKMLHKLSKTPKVQKCSFEGCLKEFKDSSVLKKHYNAVHLNIRNYLCEFCVARFKTSSALRVHISCYHIKKEDRIGYNCKVCGKTFQRKVNLRKHEPLHTNTRSYTCSFEGCGKSFRMKESMAKHENVVHKDVKPHQCKVCQERFTRKTYLNTHMYKHTGIKAFCCEICEKFFSQKGNLRTHMLLHNKERPIYTCPECFQTFNFKSNLTKHLQRHNERDDSNDRRASRYSKDVGKVDDDMEFTENITTVKIQSRRRNNRKVAKTTASRQEREMMVNEGQKGANYEEVNANVNHTTAANEKRNLNKDWIDVSECEEGSNHEKIDPDLERAVTDKSETSLEENIEIRLASNSLTCSLIPGSRDVANEDEAGNDSGDEGAVVDYIEGSESDNSAECQEIGSEQVGNDTAKTKAGRNNTFDKTSRSLFTACGSLPQSSDKILDSINNVALLPAETILPQTTEEELIEVCHVTSEYSNCNQIQKEIHKQSMEISCNENQNNASLSEDNQFINISIQNISALENDYQPVEEEVKPESDDIKTEESDCEVKVEIDSAESTSDEINELLTLNNPEYFDKIYSVPTSIDELIVKEENGSEKTLEHF